MRTLLLLILTFFIGSIQSFAQDKDTEQDPASPTGPRRTISMIKVTDSIFMLKGKGGNIGLSKGEDGVLMIDNQFADVTPELLTLVNTLTRRPVQFLVNTHHHGDHTGGNSNMLDTGTIIYAHENVRKRLLNTDKRKFLEAQEAGFAEMVKNLEAEGSKEKMYVRTGDEVCSEEI
jgi:glyoxylase-like metal-dependent hydrolase (beta-lactamase superfamily II)